METMTKDRSLDDVRHRFEWDAKNFDAIYRLERSPLSRWFNKMFRKAVFQRYEITFEKSGDLKGKSVLDIGCGSGIYSVDFARRGAKRVLGVDFSGNMLDLAREEAKKHGLSDTCEFRQQNFLDAADGLGEKFDVTIAIGVFDYLPDPIPFIKKMASVTRGRMIISIPGHSLVREHARRLRYRLTNRGDVHFYDEAEVRELVVAAGFAKHEIVRIHTSGTGFILVGDMPGSA
jgi:2-polyprenyl-3-methyl-5-hydroxy-6-metoxy-1,4-benzoquinol methylase